MGSIKKTNGHDPDAGLLAESIDLTAKDDWKRAKDWYLQLHGPSFDHVSNASDLSASPDGRKIAFTGTVRRSLYHSSRHICLIDLSAVKHEIRFVGNGPYTDKTPRWSPDGKSLAFLSDRASKGHFRLYTVDVSFEALESVVVPITPGPLGGVIEDFEWAPRGNTVLFRLAAYGIAISGFEGSGTLADDTNGDASEPAWLPTVKSATPPLKSRSLWICDTGKKQCRQVSLAGRNVWTFTWAGLDHAVALISDSSAEGAHKESVVVHMDLSNGSETIMRNADNKIIGRLASSPSGSRVALIESAGSERIKIVGDLVIMDTETRKRMPIDSRSVDVGSVTWISEKQLLAVGFRDMSSVLLDVNTATGEVREIWATTDACGGTAGFPLATRLTDTCFAVVRNSWKLPPEIGLVDSHGNYTTVVSFAHDGSKWLQSQVGDRKVLTWQSTDGLDINGLLYLPVKGCAPYRTVMAIHGGPFSAYSDCWMSARFYIPWLVANGYAVFCPNPRGSVGRGAKFASGVIEDIGGGDAQDLLTGVDHLVKLGLADPKHLGVMGGSYGGYMTLWLITQTTRFSAAIAFSPVSDYKMQWMSGDSRVPMLGNVYVKNSLAERRSPLGNVQYCQTPTLLLAGTKDTCTPAAHARVFHTALVDLGIKSVCVEYPQEGHGVRQFPAMLDSCCRVLDWCDRFM